MKPTYTDYLEFPAPLEVVLAVLRNPATWAALPTSAHHAGTIWQWGSELYAVTLEPDETPAPTPHQHGRAPTHTLRWYVAPLAHSGLNAHVTLSLYDATMSTHAVVQVSLFHKGPIWPWQHLIYRQRIATAVKRCNSALRPLLRQHQQGNKPARTDAPSPSPGAPLIEQLRQDYPQTIAHFEAMGDLEHLDNVWRLEQHWQRIMAGEYDGSVYDPGPASSNQRPQYDLIYAGGGLSLLHAAVMARVYGYRVLVFDRWEVGRAHREWNIGRNELQALVDMGVATWHELDSVIMRQYRNGVVDFASGPYGDVPHSALWMPDVLNLAIDANGLLQLMRRKLEQAGATILDYRSFRCVRLSRDTPAHVEVELESFNGGSERHTARLLLDGMGSTSPLTLLRYRGHPFGGFCPTAGTVVGGFAEGKGPRECDLDVGDILISVDDTQGERQFIWEGFPGRGDEVAVYLFYYVADDVRLAQDSKPCAPTMGCIPSYSLLELFEAYFTLLHDYKKPGPNFRHIKPVYGYIPGRHTLRPHDVPMLRGVLPIGDSAALQSPLTYCGFGSHVRNLNRVTRLLHYALQRNALEPRHLAHIHAFQTNVSLNWVFSRFMQPWGDPHNVNELQNVFLGALNQMGVAFATRFFQDRTRWHDYNRIVWHVLLRYPMIMVQSWRVLKAEHIMQWVRDYGRFTQEAAYARAGGAAGPQVEQALYWLADRLSAEMGLRVRSRYGGWRAMGWLDF